MQSGVLEGHALASLRRVLSGFAIGAAAGIVLGLAAGSLRLARLALDPYVNFFRFVPAIALLTPFVVWFGIGEKSKVLLIVFATLFIVLLNTVAGVDDIPRNRLRAGRMLGASRWQEFRLIVVPSTLPYMLTGMRIAMGVSFASIIVRRDGVGRRRPRLSSELLDGDFRHRSAVRDDHVPWRARLSDRQGLPAARARGVRSLHLMG